MTPATPAPKRAAKRAPPPPTAEERLASAFICPKGCGVVSKSKRVARAGTGRSRILDIVQHRYAAITCSVCGFSEIYDLEVVSGPNPTDPSIDTPLDG